jgi:hypothetical protein
VEVQADGYELFRRAVVAGDEDAWQAIVERYRPLLISWAARCEAAQAAGESYENLADEGLARAWRALSPERFAGFPSLATLLGYLRACVNATVIDAARARASYDRLAQQARFDGAVTPEQVVLEQLGGDELWQLILDIVESEAERIILVERFVLDLPPRTIQARHPALFSDMEKIYLAIRNLRDRLRRHKGLSQRYAGSLAV